MAQNITLMGASYSAVPGVQLPKTGGGTALFTDVTDTTAEAADVATGKYFYTASGTRVEGTNSGGGSVSQDAQGYIVLPSTGGSDFTTVTLTITDISPADFDTWVYGGVVDRDNNMMLPNYIFQSYETPSVSIEIALFKGQAFVVVQNVFASCSGGITHLGPGSPEYIITGNATLVVDSSEY